MCIQLSLIMLLVVAAAFAAAHYAAVFAARKIDSRKRQRYPSATRQSLSNYKTKQNDQVQRTKAN